RPLLRDHRGGQPRPEAEEVRDGRVEIHAAVRLAAVQVQGDGEDGDLGDDQQVKQHLPPAELEQAAGEEIEERGHREREAGGRGSIMVPRLPECQPCAGAWNRIRSSPRRAGGCATMRPCPNCPKSRPPAAGCCRTWPGAAWNTCCCAGPTCAGRSRARSRNCCRSAASTRSAGAPSTCCWIPTPAARCCTWACPAACGCCPRTRRCARTTTSTSRWKASTERPAGCCASTTRAGSAACCGRRRAKPIRCWPGWGRNRCRTTSTATGCSTSAAAARRR